MRHDARGARAIVRPVTYTSTMTKRRLTEQQAKRIQAQRSHNEGDATDSGEPGLVIARFSKQALVETSAGERILCHLRSHLDAPVAGDEVLWAPTADAGVINALISRRSVLERPDSQGRLRPVAANIDLMLVVFAPEPAPQPALLDRYLVAAEHIGSEPVLVLNKADLIDEQSDVYRALEQYAGLGYRTLTTHHEMSDASDLLALINQQTLVLVGQSGVGKSSLIQRLLPDADIRVGALSELADKGRHTTTTAELFHLPGGGRLIDSPGVRDFGLSHVSVDAVAQGFREFRPYLGKCRFRDCQHSTEPDCVLRAALEAGHIGSQRFESYQQIVTAIRSDQ